MKTEQILSQTVAAFNQRRFAEAAAHAERGSLEAAGRDELFWIGLTEICRGYALLMDRKLEPAEAKLVSAMEKLRHFGYRYQNFEVTRALAGVRRGVEEIRAVKQRRKKVFDVTLLPSLSLAAKADDS